MGTRTGAIMLVALLAVTDGVRAQQLPVPSSISVTDPLVCITGTIPGAAGQTGQVRLKVPTSRLEKFQALGFTLTRCDLPSQVFAAAGMTVCEMRARGALPSANMLSGIQTVLVNLCSEP